MRTKTAATIAFCFIASLFEASVVASHVSTSEGLAWVAFILLALTVLLSAMWSD